MGDLILKTLVTVVLCGAVAYEIGTGTAFYWRYRHWHFCTERPEFCTRDQQPRRYWQLVAKHTAQGGVYLFLLWMMPGHH